MTLIQIQKLDHIQLNNKVAELAGWERGPKKPVKCGPITIHPMMCWHRKSDEANWQDNPPEFIMDLNAMHEVVMALPSAKQVAFVTNLWHVLGHHDHVEVEAVNATAMQRAIAYIMTMERK